MSFGRAYARRRFVQKAAFDSDFCKREVPWGSAGHGGALARVSRDRVVKFFFIFYILLTPDSNN